MVLINDTTSGNALHVGNAVSPYQASGVEIDTYPSVAQLIENTIIYGNQGGSAVGFDQGPPLTFLSGGNVVESSYQAPANLAATSLDPLLGPLADHGNGVLTFSTPGYGSAYNTGSTSAPLNYFGYGTLDGRGAPLVVNGRLDAGAFESQPYYVTNTNDSGPGSLRQAVLSDDSGLTIVFSPNLAGQAITLTSGPIAIRQNLALNWSGATPLTITNNQADLPTGSVANFSLFTVAPGVTASINGFNTSGGQSVQGGGIFNAGTLHLSNDVFSNDSAFGLVDRPGQGGAIYNAGTLYVTSGYFNNDQVNPGLFDDLHGTVNPGLLAPIPYSSGAGGAIYNAAGATASVFDSTFAYNRVFATGTAQGGAIANFGHLSADDSTFANNSVRGTTTEATGGSIDNHGTAALVSDTFARGSIMSSKAVFAEGQELFNAVGQPMSIVNSIVAGNSLSGSFGHSLANYGNLTGGFNLVTSSYQVPAGLVISTADPNLSSLALNGGTVPTLALLAGSPAIAAGDPNQLDNAQVDERGYARTVGGKVDLGAFQRQLYVVRTTAGSGPGSLRQAIADDAIGDEPIVFDPSLNGATLYITHGPLVITHTLTILGPGANQITLTGDEVNQLFVVTGGNVAISGLTLDSGNARNRGGAISNSGRLTLDQIEIRNSFVLYDGTGDGAEGGAVSNAPGATLIVTNSTFDNNFVQANPHSNGQTQQAAGFARGGAIYNDRGAVLLASNDTFDQNGARVTQTPVPSSKPTVGGAIDNYGTATILSATFDANWLASGGGGSDGAAVMNESGGTLSIINTIIADGSGGGADLVNLGRTGDVTGNNNLVARGHNIASAVILSGLGPQLGPFQNNGGPTPTLAPQAGSPAIDAGDGSHPATTDQRGAERVVGRTIDIGAVEVGASLLVTATADSGPGSLRDAVAWASAGGFGSVVTFAPSLAGATITLASMIDVTAAVTIDASAAPGLTVSGGQVTRVFQVEAQGSLSLINLTVAGGHAAGGAGIENLGTLTLTGVTVAGNVATSADGGGLDNMGKASIVDSTFSGNTTTHSGGGIANAGTLSLTDVTIAGNSADTAGGLAASIGKASLRDTLIAGNTANVNQSPDLKGSILSAGHNLIGDPAGGKGLVGSDLVNVNPVLGPLQSNGGFTPTMALLPGSPAVGAGDPGGLPATDQRGLSRVTSGATDIGAYQVQDRLTVAGASATYGGTANLSATLLEAGNPLAGQTVVFLLHGLRAGTATTDTHGVATLKNVPLAGLNVGTYTGAGGIEAIFTPAAGIGRDAGDVFSTLTITPAPLTITVANASRVYGADNPAFSSRVTGLVPGDPVSVTLSTTAGPSSEVVPAGYPIVATATGPAQTLANYTITTIGGTLSVVRADAVMTWMVPASITYGTPLGPDQLDAAVNLGMSQGTIVYSQPAGTVLPAGAGYAITATFAGNNDYNPSSRSITIYVTPAPLTITANDASMDAGGNLPPLTARYTGFVGTDGPANLTIPVVLTTDASSLSAPGTYPITASGASSPNYTIQFVPGTLTVNVRQVAPTLVLSAPGGEYTGAPLAASVLIAGSDGTASESLEGSTPTLTYYDTARVLGQALPGAPTSAGGYTVVAVFPGTEHYLPATARTTFVIKPAASTVQVSDRGGVYNGSAFPARAALAGVDGRLAASLEGVVPTLTYYAGGAPSGPALPGAPVTAGTYTVLVSFPGSADYAPGTAQTTFTIGRATPNVTWRTPAPITFGTPLPSSVLNASADVPGTFVYNVPPGAPLAAGKDLLEVTFFPTDSLDYDPATASVIELVNRAAPTVNVSATGGTYTGSPFDATATVAGVGGTPGASLEQVVPSLTYYAGPLATGQPLRSAPSSAGTYTVVATFAGSADYLDASAQMSFTIARRDTTIAVSSSSVTAAPGQPLTYTATVNGGLASPDLPTGTVQFLVNGRNVGAPVPLGVGGVASLITTAPAASAGPYTITAVYSGDADFNPSTSPATTQVFVLAPGVYPVGLALYVVGSDASDSIQITPAGAKSNGGTGLAVAATLNRAWVNRTFTQPFTEIDVFGYGGNDNIQLARTLTLPASVVEGSGSNDVQLAGGNDTVVLGTGRNQVFGLDGDKTVIAKDTRHSSVYVQLGRGAHTISLGDGNDQVVLGEGPNVVTAGDGNDSVLAGRGGSVITLGDGNDYVLTLAGNDVITLGDGNDVVLVGDGTKAIRAGDGNDYVLGGSGPIAVTLGDGNDTVILGNGDNQVSLGDGNDYLLAGKGDNVVMVGDGNDTVVLGDGGNIVVEGNGRDYVLAGNGSNLVVAGLGQHTIQLGNGGNILIDGSVTLTRAVPGDSLGSILAAWKGGASAASLRPRLAVNYNTSRNTTLWSGSGRDWFLYANPKDSVNPSAKDSVSRA